MIAWWRALLCVYVSNHYIMHSLLNLFRMRPLLDIVVGTAGVCLMRNAWKEDQHPSFINFISTFLSANSFRLNFVPIAPVIGSLCFFPLFFLFLSDSGSTLKYEEFPCRILYSIVGVCLWPSFLWQTGTATMLLQSSTGTRLLLWSHWLGVCMFEWLVMSFNVRF